MAFTDLPFACNWFACHRQVLQFEWAIPFELDKWRTQLQSCFGSQRTRLIVSR